MRLLGNFELLSFFLAWIDSTRPVGRPARAYAWSEERYYNGLENACGN